MSIGNLKDTGNQGNNLPYQWKVLQGLQAIYDEISQPLTCVDDSIAICDANGDALDINANGSINSVIQDVFGNSVTTTTVGADVGLDVNIINSLPLEVNLDPDNDSVGIYGYTNVSDPTTYKAVKVDSSGAVAVQDNGGSLTIDGTVALDAGTLAALESITVQNPGGASAVNIQDGGNVISVDDAGGSLTVDTTQLPATLGKKAMTGSLSVTLANDELGIARTTGIIRPTGVSAVGNVNTVPPSGRFFSVSVANVGSANGGLLGVANSIKPGEVLNFSADAVNNYFTSFAYDATGTEFIIIFVY